VRHWSREVGDSHQDWPRRRVHSSNPIPSVPKVCLSNSMLSQYLPQTFEKVDSWNFHWKGNQVRINSSMNPLTFSMIKLISALRFSESEVPILKCNPRPHLYLKWPEILTFSSFWNNILSHKNKQVYRIMDTFWVVVRRIDHHFGKGSVTSALLRWRMLSF
jgi:hypothetical protein